VPKGGEAPARALSAKYGLHPDTLRRRREALMLEMAREIWALSVSRKARQVPVSERKNALKNCIPLRTAAWHWCGKITGSGIPVLFLTDPA
jgi:hypothetical protein